MRPGDVVYFTALGVIRSEDSFRFHAYDVGLVLQCAGVHSDMVLLVAGKCCTAKIDEVGRC